MPRLYSVLQVSRLPAVRNGILFKEMLHNRSIFLHRVFSDKSMREFECTEAVDLRKLTNMDLKKLYGRQNIRSKLTTVSLNVLGTGRNEVGPSFFVNCTGKTYFFNCGEGWGRMAATLHDFSREQIMFFTQASWETVGGGSGFYYHQKNRFHDSEELYVQSYCGPQKVDFFLRYIQAFTGKNTWSKIGLFEPEKPGLYKDQNLSMLVIELKPQDTVNWHSVVAYSCKLADVSGKFLVEKAMELGIKPGPIYNVLQQGKSIITEEGVLVHPSQVMASENKGPTFLVVDCPTESFIDAVTSNKYLQPEWFCELGQNVNLIVHITPLHILQQEAYCKWMSSFGCDTKHLLLHASICPGEVGYRTAITFSLPFHLMNPNVYHFPIFPNDNVINKKDLNISKYINEDSQIIGQMFLKYHLKPTSKGIDYSNCLTPVSDHVKQVFNAIKKQKMLANGILRHRNLLSINGSLDEQEILPMLGNTDILVPIKEDDALVTILGSSSAQSTACRNVSGILIQTSSDGNILLDCGEGTLQQLYRCFGHGFAKDILRKLNLIFISHMHTDHHMGVIGILNEVKKLTMNDEFRAVKIISSNQYPPGLNKYSSLCENVQFEFINAKNLLNMPYHCNDITFETMYADHIPKSFGIVVRQKNKWSIVYSGDTTPSKHVIKAGRNATLLIHEGTYENLMAEEAVKNKHSTYADAVRMGRAMNAGFTIVTHFSTRNRWYPFLEEYWTSLATPAVDLMSIRMSDLHNQQLDSASCRNVFHCMALCRTI